ncbi:MAG: prepilin-type N-terminal cleavage/methylation domain-containing protein [candidate division WOR-3 bacterium]|jgi:type II secretory pathway pseudopilin PulG
MGRIHDRSSNSSGMTLVELLVSLVILMVVLGAVYSILNLQQTKSTQVTRTTVLQTDAQVAFTLIKWDLLLAGLGFPFGRQDAFQLSNNGSDVTLRATGLGFEMNYTQWSYLLDNVNGSILPVRRWDDTLADFTIGDTVMIMSEVRDPVHQDLIVTGIDTFTYYDPIWSNPTDGFRVQVDRPIRARAGLMVFKRNADTYFTGVTYRLAGDTLMRGNEALLTNVEAIQFRYGIDTDGDNLIDDWRDTNNPLFNPDYGTKWAVRFTMVITSEVIVDYQYPADSVVIEDDPPYAYPLTPLQKRRKRAILSSVVYPPNLQPGEG